MRLQAQYYSRDMDENILTAALSDYVHDLKDVGVCADVLMLACKRWRTNGKNTRMATSGQLLDIIRPLMLDRRRMLRGLERVAASAAS